MSSIGAKRFNSLPSVPASETNPIHVVLVGLGAIGQSLARLVHQKADLVLVGGVDIVPDLQGRDLGDVLGFATPIGSKVSDDLTGALRGLRPDVAVVCTGSVLDGVAPQLRDCFEHGVDIVSTCEQLAYCSSNNRQLWKSLDEEARQADVSVLGTGVNPGFIMDSLPLFVTAVSEQIDRIHLHRMVDASKRRRALQRKIGAGISLDEFHRLSDGGMIGHVGLTESANMISGCLGWNFDVVETAIEPHVAERQVTTPHLTIEPGYTTGIHQVIRGIKGGETLLTLELDMRVDSEDSFDRIVVEGIPDLNVFFESGIHGDIATSAITVNAIPRLAEAGPGLLTMTDIPLLVAAGAV